MKNLNSLKILTGALIAGVALNASAYRVGTAQSPKALLLEEATGLLCTSCPNVQPSLDKVLATYPNSNLIAIHGYHFKNNTFDMSTPGGDEIVDEFDIMSYPQLMINRVLFPTMDRRFMSEPFWNRFLPQEAQLTAPVNLWLYSWLNEETGIVTVMVEGYFLEDVSNLDPHLNVVMLQDGLMGPQAGAPAAQKDTWISNHVLRDFITPTWGEPIKEAEEDCYFTRTYKYELPKEIGIYPVVNEDLTFVAFVTEGKVNSMNSVSCRLAYDEPQEEAPVVLDSSFEEPDVPVAGSYGYNFIEFYLTNDSSQPLNTASFDVTLNGVSSRIIWRGEIAEEEKALIRLPANWFDAESRASLADVNTYSIKCVKLNGYPVEFDVMEGEFAHPEHVSKELRLQVSASGAPVHAINIFNTEGESISNFILSDGYDEVFKLENNEVYCLEVMSSDADVIFADAVFSLYDVRMDTLLFEDEPLTPGTRFFFLTDQGYTNEVGVLSASEAETVEIYTMSGVRVAHGVSSADLKTILSPGLYIVKSAGTVSKILIP